MWEMINHSLAAASTMHYSVVFSIFQPVALIRVLILLLGKLYNYGQRGAMSKQAMEAWY